MSKKTKFLERWKRAGEVQLDGNDDYESIMVFNAYGKPVRVKRWIQIVRFLRGDKNV